MTAAAMARPAPEGARLPFFVSRLAMTSFRSYDAAEVVSDGRPLAFWGPNGAGKTNILEALSLLAPGRGLRGARLGDAMRRAGGGTPRPWAVAARVRLGDDEVALRTGVDGNERREVRIDGEKAVPGDLGDHLRLLWLTPAMDRLFTDTPGARRRFLDRMVLGLSAEHGRLASAYEQAMRERQKLLSDGRHEPAWLEGLELTMATSGLALAQWRRRLLSRLVAAIGDAESAFPRAGVTLDEGFEAGEVETLTQQLADARRRDEAAGRCTVGPHRADLCVRHREKDMPAADCSTGEQKALLIGLVLANARLQAAHHGGAAPLLLLDEVAAHLDENRRADLFDEIAALGAQAWMTGTDAALFTALGPRARQFEVKDGAIRQCTD
jgi:DNA replication and repair protein RecF